MVKTRICKGCNIEKLERDFYKYKAQGGKKPMLFGKCKSCHKELRQKYSKDNRASVSSYAKQYARKIRLEVLEHYGAFCACCGEDNVGFLTVDHINNDGHLSKNLAGNRKASYWEAKRQGLPDTFQVLCCNCNLGKSWNNGVCPHKD